VVVTALLICFQFSLIENILCVQRIAKVLSDISRCAEGVEKVKFGRRDRSRMEPLFANIVGPYYRRDAIGRVVVEDGLARMEPRGQGLHTRALKGASDALTHAHALLSEIGNININFANISIVQEYRRDAIGRVVIEDGLARMEPRGAGLHARAIKGARDALARVSGLLSQGGDALGGALSSLKNLMGPQYRRDAIGRVVTEDGLVRIYGHPELHTVTISSIKAAVASAISNLRALQDGMMPSWPTSSSVGSLLKYRGLVLKYVLKYLTSRNIRCRARG
jgi:hypothetical protein